MAVGYQPGFDQPEIAPFDPPTPKTLEPNMKWIGWPVAEIWPFKIRHIRGVAFGTPFWAKGRSYGVINRSYHWKARWWFPSYTLPIAAIALSVTIYSAAICHRMSATLNSTGGGSLRVKMLGRSLWSKSVLSRSAEREYPRISNREIIFEGFQPICDHDTSTSRTDGQTDDLP